MFPFGSRTQSLYTREIPLPFRIAFRNLLRRGSRFLFLLVLLAFSSLVILSIASLFDTLVFNLKRKGSVYYGGDITIRGLKDRYQLIIEDPEPLRKGVQETLSPETVVSPRINYRNSSTTLFFCGGIDPTADRERGGFYRGGIDLPADYLCRGILHPPARPNPQAAGDPRFRTGGPDT